jgi:general secretion pathway protein J
MTLGHTQTGRGASGQSGFTLVELLVALALFSLLVTVLFNNVHFGLQAWKHGGARAEDIQHMVASQELLRRLIGDIYPMYVTDSAAGPRVDFDGTKDTLSFLAGAPASANTGGRYRLKLSIERQSGEDDLVLSAMPELAQSLDTVMSTRTVLLRDVDHADFSYFGRPAGERNPQWIDGWSKRSETPALVRFRMAFRPGDMRSWPDLVVAPRMTADVSCVYDPLTMRCRGR